LRGHLNAPSTDDATATAVAPSAAVENDFQLGQALTLLKGIALLNDKTESPLSPPTN